MDLSATVIFPVGVRLVAVLSMAYGSPMVIACYYQVIAEEYTFELKKEVDHTFE
jgi:hypothetical protein